MENITEQLCMTVCRSTVTERLLLLLTMLMYNVIIDGLATGIGSLTHRYRLASVQNLLIVGCLDYHSRLMKLLRMSAADL